MSNICWVDLGGYGTFLEGASVATESWQDHGLGLLRTIMHQAGILTHIISARNYQDCQSMAPDLSNYNKIIMNVRSYSYWQAKEIAELYKKIRPDGVVIVGGMNTVVNLKEMEEVSEFDFICVGSGENTIVDLVVNCQNYQRVTKGFPAEGMGDWPTIDRTLWPKPQRSDLPYPLEPTIQAWNVGPIATIITSRVCPWRCSFCNEASYIKNLQRKPVEKVIAELNELDNKYGPIGSLVIHDSMFFQHPAWLEEWCEKYPKLANKVWPYWAAARADTVRKWPDLFKKLVMKTNWNIVSIGLESGSENSLLTLNKECSVQDNLFAIMLINQLGDIQESQGILPVRMFTNLMFGVPGETRSDIFDTLKMLSCIKRGSGMISPSLYAPYPGGALGYQLIAEGKSLMGPQNQDRSPNSKKINGIDYNFIDECLRGMHNFDALHDRDQWIASKLQNGKIEKLDKFRPPASFYRFKMKNGKEKISWGVDCESAITTLKLRLSIEEIRQIDFQDYEKLAQQKLPEIVDQLG